MSGALIKVEELTKTEMTELAKAEKNVEVALKQLETVKTKISAAHEMEGESWMEWKSWVEFDGIYILLKHQSFHANFDIHAKERRFLNDRRKSNAHV